MSGNAWSDEDELRGRLIRSLLAVTYNQQVEDTNAHQRESRYSFAKRDAAGQKKSA
jgi:hypothetical protein